MFQSSAVARQAIQIALHKTVANYRNEESRGAVGLARRLGFREASFSNKCGAQISEHQISLIDAVLVMKETNDFTMLYAICALLGHVSHTLPDFARCSDIELLSLWAAAIDKQGAHAHAVRSALDDGEITQTEIDEVRATLQSACSAGLAFVARLEGLVK